MSKDKTFEEQILEKYPNLYNGESCCICKADLRYLDLIHRINMKWYCDICYRKQKYISAETKIFSVNEFIRRIKNE